MPEALGLIETRGLVGAIEAADAMVKAANVHIAGKELAGGGLVTIKILGEVAAVRSAIDAGAVAAKKVGELKSIHIIPKPDEELIKIFPELSGKPYIIRKSELISKTEMPISEEMEERTVIDKPPPQKIVTENLDNSIDEVREKIPVEKPEQVPNLFEQSNETISRLRKEALGIKDTNKAAIFKFVPKAEKKTLKITSLEQLNDLQIEDLDVHQLRHLARNITNFPIQGRQISKASRKELVEYFNNLIK